MTNTIKKNDEEKNDEEKKANKEIKNDNSLKTLFNKIKELALRPRNKKPGVNISKIKKLANKIKQEVVFVVPDKVLGDGSLNKPIKICALGYSKTALEELKRTSSKIIAFNFSELKNILKNEKIKIVR
jgi:ribosomal protein L18E